jgi:hypothetical protein
MMCFNGPRALPDDQWPAEPVEKRFELQPEEELPENPMQRAGMGEEPSERKD